MKKNVRLLFSFSKPEVDTTFGGARLLAKTQGIKLLVAPASELQASGKMLIIIPRRAGKAHDRNRIRRQIKDIFYRYQLYTTKATFIVLVYEQAVDLTFDQLKTFFCQAIPVDPKG